MDALGCAGEEHQMRQRAKRKRLDQCEDCMSPKRQLTEETMAAVMGQLNLSAAPPLSITTVSPCPASLAEHSSDLNDVESIRGAPPLPASNGTGNGYITHTRNTSDNSRRLTPPRTVRAPRPTTSPVVDGLDLASGMKLPPHLTNVRIRVTPATPPSSESSVSPAEESEPMEQAPETTSSLHRSRRKNWDVILEDISSDSSDGPDSSSEMSQQLWLAPELQTLTAARKNLLLPSILDEINKKEMALIPWVEPERRLHDIVARGQATCGTCVDEPASDSEESQEEKSWDYSMHTD